jgi:hypothetical protein
MILACSARKTLKINRNHPKIEGPEPQKYMKAHTKSQHTEIQPLNRLSYRFSLIFIQFVI